MKALILTCLLLIALPSWSESTRPEFFKELWKNTTESFSNDKAYFHLAGVGLTPLLIHSGVDAHVNRAFAGSSSASYYPGVFLGGVGPALVGLPLWFHGKTSNDDEALGAAYAVAHSTIISVTYVGLLKGLTGRPEPDNDDPTSMQEQSEEFNFGILKRGVYWGWPSGHMATTSAVVTALTHYYPEKTWLQWAGYGAAAYMLLTVSAHNQGQMHWFSDGVAGSLMGYAIGSTVGSNFRERIRGQETEKKKYTILPLLGPERSGVKVVWVY